MIIFCASATGTQRTASLAAETFATDHNDTYAGIEPSVLHEYEAAIQTGESSGNAYLSAAKSTESGNGYVVTAVAATTKDKFTIERSATGVVTRKCESEGKGCSGGKTSSW